MTLRNIVIEPDPILRKKSSKLENVDDNTRKLLDDMLQTMYKAPGIGLAAVQIGVLKRLIVIDISKREEEKKPIFLINPEIKFKSKKLPCMKRVVYHFRDTLPKLKDHLNVVLNM